MRSTAMCVSTLFIGAFLLWRPAPVAAQSEVQAQEFARLAEIQTLHEDEVLNIPGVVGIGIGKGRSRGQLEYKVFVKELSPEVQAAVPKEIDGVPASIVVSGDFTIK